MLAFHTQTLFMKISSIWLYASSLYPKASFPAGTLRELREGGDKHRESERKMRCRDKERNKRGRTRDSRRGKEKREGGHMLHIPHQPMTDVF